ncbi:MAG: flagellar hook-length control protein FliK [Alphaproteobacteria bacterium]|nr:flagellar hook-length control protein FliK [Alphaproteobacteria bacterium]
MNQIAALFANTTPQNIAGANAFGSIASDMNVQFADILAQEQLQPVAPVSPDPSSLNTQSQLLALLHSPALQEMNSPATDIQLPQGAPATLNTQNEVQPPSDLAGLLLVIQNVQGQPPEHAKDALSALPAANQAVSVLLANKGAQAPIQHQAPTPVVATPGLVPELTPNIAPLAQSEPPVVSSKTNQAPKRTADAMAFNPASDATIPTPQAQSFGEQKIAPAAASHSNTDQQPQSHTPSNGAAKTSDAVASSSANASPAVTFTTALIQAQSAPANTVPHIPVPLDALAVHIARKVESGSSQFEISLHPADLGKLDISLTVGEDGRVQAVLRAERTETLELLQRDARTLEQQLRQAGLDVGSNALSFQLSNGNGQRSGSLPASPFAAKAQNGGDASDDQLTTNYIAVRKRDGVDITV